MSDILDDNEDYQEDTEQVEDNEVIDDEQDIEDSQDGEQDSGKSDDSTDDDVLDFSFDDDGEDKDEFAGQPAPEWVKEVRKENRELKRQLKQRESQQHEQQQALREMPTLDDHEYDEDGYQKDLVQWFSEKQQHEVAVQAEQQKYQQYHERYKANVDAVRAKAPDYDDAETMVVETLSINKQHLLQMLVEKPAAVVYALGRNSPAQLENLSKLDDIQFARQIVLMEQQMSSKTKSRNPNKPPPKTHELEGAAGGADTQLAKLEAEAAKTGDRSKIHAYNRSKRQSN